MGRLLSSRVLQSVLLLPPIMKRDLRLRKVKRVVWGRCLVTQGPESWVSDEHPWLQPFLLPLTLTLAVQALVWKRKKCDLERGSSLFLRSAHPPDTPILYGSLPTPGWYCSQFLSAGEYTHMPFRLAEWTVSNIWLYCWNFSPPPPDSCYHRELPEIYCFFFSHWEHFF